MKRKIFLIPILSVVFVFAGYFLVNAKELDLDQYVDIDENELNERLDKFLDSINDPELKSRAERVRADVEQNGWTDSNEKEVREILKLFTGDRIKAFFGGVTSKISGIGTKIKDLFKKDKEGFDEEGYDENGLDEDGFDRDGNFVSDIFDTVGSNEFKTQMWPDEEGVKVAKIVGPYGEARYTADGKHYYDTPAKASLSTGGIRKGMNNISDAFGSFASIFSFSTSKTGDPEKDLQREIAREVLKDSKSQSEKDAEKAFKAFEKTGKKLGGKLVGVPADVVVQSMKEANATEFAQGVMIYITEREGKDGITGPKTANHIFSSPPEELGPEGGFKGVSAAFTAGQPKAVLFSRYEEAYQRYLVAKELGRK